MQTLVVGGSGATGRELVKQLLIMGHTVKILVRSLENLPITWKDNDRITIIQKGILDIDELELVEHLRDCGAVLSCLGHNLTLKGIFGAPHKLVFDAVCILCKAINSNSPKTPVKFVLMNTTGNRNRDLNEPVSIGQRIIIGVLRLLLPPQADNEKAANYLRMALGQTNKFIEWIAVRPDGLINEAVVTEYKVYPSPIRSAIFNAGVTSRINVANFMASLITNNDLWNEWKGKMPVIYNVNKSS